MIGDLVGDCLQLIIARIRVGMRVKQKVVDAFELLSVDVGASSELEHAVKADGRFGPFFVAAFTDETGPHCVMEFGIIHR